MGVRSIEYQSKILSAILWCYMCLPHGYIQQGSARMVGLQAYFIGEKMLHSTQTLFPSFHADEYLSSIFNLTLRQVDKI